MKKLLLLILFIFCINLSQAQNTFTAIVKDKQTNEPLFGADCILKETSKGSSANMDGEITIQGINNGKQIFLFSYIGYQTVEKELNFPLQDSSPIIIYLKQNQTLKTITVYSTRTNNRIEEIPTKVEVLGQEEVIEETAINPGNISKLLGETSGIQVQHTSAISGNVSFRIQGLPGKYTQLLQDGFPMYGGFSSGLSLLQIPPLDLQQVEIVKGSASTLYGGDAIAGIVNLITKKPKRKSVFSILFNQTHKGGQDISSFYSGKKGKFGITFLASSNTQKAKDINGNNFTDIPKYNRAVISPKIFYDFNKNNHLLVGLSSVIEDRIGGNFNTVNDNSSNNNLFFEENKTKRINTSLKFESENKSGNIFTVKASFGNFNRKMKTNTNRFNGIQNTIFTELSYYTNSTKHKWVNGLNYYSDKFNQSQPTTNLLNYKHQTIGLFSQDNWHISKKLFLEPGIRYDYNYTYGSFFLPRLAMMYHFSDTFFTRFSVGLGYKLPTPFTDDAERTRYQNIQMPNNLQVEKSNGVNLDFNYKTLLFDELNLSINQSFFITKINKPIIAANNLLQNQIVSYKNANGNILSKGLNTNISLRLDELVLYVDYTYLKVKKSYDFNKPLELTPQNKITSTLAYEDEDEGWKTGLEAFYFGNQYLENGNKTPNYWLLGASAQKTIGHFTVALNIENILDIRQTRYENIVNGPLNNPNFNELYAPLDGVIGNMVLKFTL
ncbi:TonB-dependent receptor [Lutibacter sp.]|uniref:TonB-dependent receptor n=1 Tax=Lutibacter sp. TaxID=1925666 RepID=UPI0025C7175D|nr:TonB-dependent receptor [Lutibacter sp.]MCF6180837.1 TonB-dependent receptor [Lutibacter sp.]